MRTGLSCREIDVLRLVIGGETNHAIGKKLGISPETVKRHMYSIMLRKKAKNRTELAVEAIYHPEWFHPVCRCDRPLLTGYAPPIRRSISAAK